MKFLRLSPFPHRQKHSGAKSILYGRYFARPDSEQKCNPSAGKTVPDLQRRGEIRRFYASASVPHRGGREERRRQPPKTIWLWLWPPPPHLWLGSSDAGCAAAAAAAAERILFVPRMTEG